MEDWRLKMSSSAGFPINDLLRRRLQTGIVITTLTLSVASTLFLLQFSSRLGVGLSSSTGMFTMALKSIFSQFITFIGALVFAVGIVLTSFIVLLMMTQRTRDFGLIKAVGCPSSLVGGYFMTELILVMVVSCVLGLVFGFFADFIAANAVFGSYQLINWWFAPILFVIFFLIALFFGLQPILKAAKLSAIEALSPVNYYGLIISGKYKALSHTALTWRIASRSMARRISPTVRIVILLSIIFVLLTVSVAGGIIAEDTTTSWVRRTVNSGTIAVAYSSIGDQYKLLLSKFIGTQDTSDFNYSDTKWGISAAVEDKLKALPSIISFDTRLVLYENVQEIKNWTIINGAEMWVGGDREEKVLVIGSDPRKMTADFSNKGRSLSGNDTLEAIIGDSISQTMYYPDESQDIYLSDPLVQGIEIEETKYGIVGVCVDPINNGYVVYVPIDKLINSTGLSDPNLILLMLDGSVDRRIAIEQIRNTVKEVDSDLEVFDLTQTIADNTDFLSGTWQTILFVPLFTLISAALCLVSYMMLSIDEQRQEFAMLRAVGARPRLIVNISAIQSAIVLLSSFGIGISFGVIITLIILMTNPIVTSTTIVEIVAWFISALLIMFLLSLYPAFRIAKTSILKIMT
jgi:ABC-type antimicrobial peptide transport system permease subunit